MLKIVLETAREHQMTDVLSFSVKLNIELQIAHGLNGLRRSLRDPDERSFKGAPLNHRETMNQQFSPQTLTPKGRIEIPG